MVDTVKLLIDVSDPLVFDGNQFTPITLQQLINSSGGRTYLNPSSTYAKIGTYMPRLTMHKRPITHGYTYQLSIEFSAPKMLFGNNFDELSDDDFQPLLHVLRERLYELLHFDFSIQQLANADVSVWHPSKNIIFRDGTASQTILNIIGKLDISRVYDLQKTNFRDGYTVHIHCNSLDIAFYDKLADLRKARISPKRSVETDSLIQLGLLQHFKRDVPFEVLRYEVRLVGRKRVKSVYKDLTSWTFAELFKMQLCKNVLLEHWYRLTKTVTMLSLDVQKPYELLQNYLIDNPTATPQTALAAVSGLLINGQQGVAGLRNLIEASYGTQAWYRLKPIFKSPSSNRYQHFLHVSSELEQFVPISVKTCLALIE